MDIDMTLNAKWLHHIGLNNLAFWSENWTSNISEIFKKTFIKYRDNLMKIFLDDFTMFSDGNSLVEARIVL
jgi:hypothetical protein